jgi:hypothetical protein
MELLTASRATALLSYPMDLQASYDRRLEPLVQAAAGIFRIARDERGARRLEVVALRYAPALPGAIDYAALPNVAVPDEPLEIR